MPNKFRVYCFRCQRYLRDEETQVHKNLLHQLEVHKIETKNIERGNNNEHE